MGIYLDHAATTYTDERVMAAMLPYFTQTFGNPSSLHANGRSADSGVRKARQQTAQAIGASTAEVYFTSGGTESDNWAIKGAAAAAGGGHIITSAVEHHAVLGTCEWLAQNGFDVTYLPVDADGLVRIADVENALRDDTVLISVMFANNETGVMMPVSEIGALARERGVLFHTDAVQAAGHVPIDVEAMGIDMLSLSAHKFYGPKGAGALYIRKGTQIGRLMHGGAQEREMRAGTLNTPGIVGLGEAIEIAAGQMAQQAAHEAALAQRLKQGLLSLPDTALNGHAQIRLPGNVNISFDGIEAEALMLHLDLEGISVSTGSACASGSAEPSYVLEQMGRTATQARAAVRFTVGRANTEQQIDTVVETTKRIVKQLRDISPVYRGK